jgi:putative ABC transport system permease protein
MVKNYLKVAIRSILKNKIFTAINILGLAIGIATFLLLVQYVIFEKSYESFIKDSDLIYRVTLDQYSNNEIGTSSAENYPGLGPAMKSDVPGVQAFARLYNTGNKNNVVISYEEGAGQPIKFKHKKFLYADSSFLPMFGYELVKGDVNTALAEPNTAVISERYAKMYFGDVDPIGKILRLQADDNNNVECLITGLFKDLPQNTHLKFEILFSYTTLYGRGDWAPRIFNGSWNQKGMYTFVKLFKNTDPDIVESKLPALIEKYSPNLAARNREDVMLMQPLKDIHLYSNRSEEAEINGNGEAVSALGLVAIFILIIAWVNYVNLSTAKAVERSNEVGVRKAMGAYKHQLMRQFLVESAIINFLAMLMALLLMILTAPLFNSITGHSFIIDEYFNTTIISMVIGLWMVGTLLSGIYPAFVLSSFEPISVLKGKLKSNSSGILLRRSLVILQFVVSVGLIAATIIVYNQIDFMRNHNIGMDIDQVLVIERPGIIPDDSKKFNANVDVFRNELKNSTLVQYMSMSATVPGNKQDLKARGKIYGQSDDDLKVFIYNSMDHDFLNVFKMKVIAGRGFSIDHPSDVDTAIVITQSAVKLLGFKSPEDAIGVTLSVPAFRMDAIIVGVVNDYNQVSLQKAQESTFFHCSLYNGEYYSIRINGDNVTGAIEQIKESWDKAFPGNPFEYFFLDDHFNRLYAKEQQFRDLFAVFSILAISIGCLGLFGLSAFTAQQRTKEVGIRKVLGSSVGSIFALLSKEFVYLILIGVLIATPLTYYFMDQWLASFAYKQPISWWVFPISGLSVILIALITVSFQTIKAATINPITSLRYE